MFGEKVQWGDSEHLLADIRDLLNGGNWQRGHKKGSRPPEPLPRPGTRRRTRRTTLSPAEVRARLLAQQRRR